MRSIWASSLSADAMLATVEDGDNDPCLINVAISNPDRERWRRCDAEFVPFVSPDAEFVALREREAHNRAHGDVSIEIRDLDSGDSVVQHEADLPPSAVWMPLWESEEALLVFVQNLTDHTPYLLRCPVSDAEGCERVPAADGGTVTAVAVERW